MLFSGKENILQCLVVFLKISQKTHFLLVAHIFLVAKRIYNIIHSSKHKQNPEKNHQIRTFRTIAIDASCDRDWRGACDVGGRSQQSKLWTISASSALDDIGELGFGRSLLSLLSFSLSLFLSLSAHIFSHFLGCQTNI